MALKRPGNSRNDQSGRSSNRTSKPAGGPKRSSSRAKSSSGPDQIDFNKPAKKYSSERTGEKRSFSSSGSKPYQSRQNDGDKPASSFTGGEKKSFTPKGRPYTGRPSDNDDKPKRSFGGESSGEKRSFAPKSRPYTGRIADNDERPKAYRGGESSGDKRPFAPKSKSYSGRSDDNDERPKEEIWHGESSEGKDLLHRAASHRLVLSTMMKDQKEAPIAIGAAINRLKKNSAAGHLLTLDSRNVKATGHILPTRPQRSKPSYGKITPDLDAPVKTLRGRKKGPESKDSGLIRLNRYISNAGICSRRKADELIVAGVVSVNGVVISELGHKVDPQKDEIRYNGETLKREKMVYVLLNKPKDYITTTEDPQERRTVMNLVEKASKERIYPIGRLDRNTTGLLLMTNDGDLADKLSHPKNNIVKLYQVELNKSLTQGDLNKIGFGLELEDGLIKPDSISYVAGGSKREIGIQIHSGKNRIVRRIFEHLGYEVVKLDRAVYANLTKKDLPRGRWRFLDESEVIQLKHLI